MKIRHKLTLSFLLVATLASATTFFTFRSYAEIDSTFDRLMNDSTRTIIVLNRIQLSGLQVVSSTSEIPFGHNGREEGEPEKELLQLKAQGYDALERNVAAYGEMAQTIVPEDLNSQEAIRSVARNLIETSREIVALKRRGTSGVELEQKKAELEAHEFAFMKFVNAALALQSEEQSAERESVAASLTDASRRTAMITILTFALSIFSGWYISFLISGRVRKLQEASRKVGDGELDTYIEINSRDEIGDLSISLNKMIAGLKQSRNAMQDVQGFTDSVIASIANVLFVLDMDLNIVRVNGTALDTCKYKESELIGRSIKTLRPDGRFFDKRDVLELHAKGSVSGIETFLRCKDGEQVPILFSASIMRHTSGSAYGIVCVAQDITERKLLEKQLTHQALHDPLTKLANRVLFRDRVEHAIGRAKRKTNTVSVLFLDLDNFKGVNDSLGHAAGDELLVSVTARLNACLRPCDTSARLGGDEFAILVEDIESPNEAISIAERIRAFLSAPFSIEGTEVFVRTSIGIATTTTDRETPEELLRNADLAMYMSKSNGKDRYTVFENEMHDVLVKRVRLESDMRKAIDEQQFEVYYQPIIDLQSNRVMGLEALVRWNHPIHGLIPPMDFIPLAEETGLIVPLGRWILDKACLQAAVWQSEYGYGKDLSITVNIASRQFQDEGLLSLVENALRKSALPAESLVLEITESTMLSNAETTFQKLTALKQLGIRLAIDDFGTGYSSLSYLQRFPVDILKIDKSFIDKVALDKEGAAVARAIITMSGTLHLKTIAEGVETRDQQAQLKKLGCEMGQGYHFAKPLRASDMKKFLRKAVTFRDDSMQVISIAASGSSLKDLAAAL